MHIAQLLGKSLPPITVGKNGAVTSPKKDWLVFMVNTAWQKWVKVQVENDEDTQKNKVQQKQQNTYTTKSQDWGKESLMTDFIDEPSGGGASSSTGGISNYGIMNMIKDFQ